jgi:hypothetical protein
MKALPSRFTISNAITAGLTAIERARGFLEAATLSDDWVRRMSQRALLLEALSRRNRDTVATPLATGLEGPLSGLHSRRTLEWLFVRKTCWFSDK